MREEERGCNLRRQRGGGREKSGSGSLAKLKRTFYLFSLSLSSSESGVGSRLDEDVCSYNIIVSP